MARSSRNFLKVTYWLAIIVLLFSAAAQAARGPGKYYSITVLDEESGRGVPLVELTTTNNIRYYTDSNGIVAFYEPGFMGLDVHFLVMSMRRIVSVMLE